MTSTSSSKQNPPSTSSADLPTTNAPQLDPNAQLSNNGYAPNDNQLAGLVEAANAARSQDSNSEWAAAAVIAAAAGAAGHHNQLDGYAADMHLGDDGFGDASFGTGMGGGRHLRVPTHSDQPQSSGLSRTVSKKRKRNEHALDPALVGASGGVGLSGPQHQHSHSSQQHNPQGHSGDGLEIRHMPGHGLPEARAVGVHSAAALFRQPSSNKKYTRPPMSNLFTSLELSPENFLHLQAAAKAYMLDDQHPERRDCVGQRGKGDTEMVKLRLWNCVRHFLEAEGNGERFFGEHVVNEGMGPRAYIWPRDQQKIISLVIPLLRRMVTNERQRQYAIETRKGRSSEERPRRRTNELQNMNSPRFSPEQQLQIQTQPHRDDLGQAIPPPAPELESGQQPMDLGLTDLLLDGYPMNWNELARSYDMYNQGFELDNLWSLSGLQQQDWRGLVAAVDSHYQVIHSGDYRCPPGCEDENINRIVHASSTSSLPWRIGGDRNVPARDEFASSITRDVSRIIRENLAARDSGHAAPHEQVPVSADQQFHSQQPFTPLQGPHTAATSITSTSHINTQNPVSLRVNILQHGKRILHRLDLPANEYPDVETVKQTILRRYPDQIPGISQHQYSDSLVAVTSQWKIQVWLPDGLVQVQNQKDWTYALLSADTVDWMDGDLKVLVEIEGSARQ